MLWKDNKSEMRVAASILSADFAHLADEVKRVTDAGIEQIHIEVGDGVFSPDLFARCHGRRARRQEFAQSHRRDS